MAPNTRDYNAWHAGYDDPESTLSWRLRTVQGYISRALDGRNGPVRIISACAGDGRDLIGVLSGRGDVARVRATLLEVHPVIAERARVAAAAAGLSQLVQVRTSDAGVSDAYRDLAPADLVLLVGIFGNISDADLHTTIEASAQLCAPGGTLIWSRGRDPDTGGDRNATVRAWFADAWFSEIGYDTRESGSLPAVGAVCYDGPLKRLKPGQRWFTFLR